MPLKQNSKAPDFCLKDQNDKKVCLSDFKGRWVVLYFYVRDDTPGCTIQAKDFTKDLKEFEKLNAVVLGVSPDSVESHKKFVKKYGLKVRLLSDEIKSVAKKYKVWGKKKFMGREFMGVIRSTFLIAPEGKIADVWSPVKVKGHGLSVYGKLRELS